MPTKNPQVLLTVGNELLEMIDDFRYEHRFPSRSQAMRSLIIQALRVNGKYYETGEEKAAREKRYREKIRPKLK